MSETLRKVAALSAALAVFTLVSLLRFSGGFKWPGYDASEYHYVAKNIAAGKSLEVRAVTQFYPRPPSVVHKIIPFHMPANYYILAASYKIFGDNSFGARGAGVLLDLVLVAAIFFWTLKLTGGAAEAFFAAAIYSAHPFALDARAGGGAAAGFAAFFGAFMIWHSWRAFSKPRAFIWAGVFGALSYLTRNEGIFSLAAMAIVLILSLKASRSAAPQNGPSVSAPSEVSVKSRLRFFAAGCAAILAVFVLWETRNYAVYGAEAASSRHNMMFGRDYYDMWRYNPEPGLVNFIREYIKIGPVRAAVAKAQSFHYKAARAMLCLGVPLALFLLPGARAVKDKSLLWPAGVYLAATYLFFGFFNSHSQDWGWYGAEVTLPFWVILAVAGCFDSGVFSSASKKRMFGFAAASAILLFYVGDAARAHVKSKRDVSAAAVEVLARAVGDFSRRNGGPVIMLHSPFVFNYYEPSLKTVQIPTNEPLETVLEVAGRYGCEYLVLYGDIPSKYPFVFGGLYAGRSTLRGFREVVNVANPPSLPLEGAGERLKIYRIDKTAFSPMRLKR